MAEPPLSPRVLLVDDHEIYRAGLRGLLEEAGIDIVGEAASGEVALELVEAKHPNVVIMDLNMPGIGGIEAARQIATVAPLARVIMLTVSSAAPDITDAVLAGACGYLLKSATTQEIVSGIAAASRGDALLSPSVAAKLLERGREQPARPAGRRAAGAPGGARPDIGFADGPRARSAPVAVVRNGQRGDRPHAVHQPV